MTDARTANLLGAFLTGVGDHMRRTLERESGLTGDDPAALTTICHNEGLTVERLRKTLSRSHSWTVRMVEKLEQAGFVEKQPGTQDKRSVALFLTGQGRRKVQNILQARRHCLNDVLTALPAQDQKQLAGMLERMLTVITGSDDQAEAICKLCEVDACPQERCPVTLAIEHHG